MASIYAGTLRYFVSVSLSSETVRHMLTHLSVGGDSPLWRWGRLLLPDHWYLQISGPVGFGIKAAAIDISCTPEHHAAIEIDQVKFFK